MAFPGPMAGATAPNLVDTRLLGKVQPYSGKREEWAMWKFRFRSYIGAISRSMLNQLDRAEALNRPVAAEDLQEEPLGSEASSVMFVMSQVFIGTSLKVIMNIPIQNGFEAWRTRGMAY